MAIRDAAFTGLMVRYRRSGERTARRLPPGGQRRVPAEPGRHAAPPSWSRPAILHVTGITPALSDSARAAVFQAVETARAAGVPVSVDVNYRSQALVPLRRRAGAA